MIKNRMKSRTNNPFTITKKHRRVSNLRKDGFTLIELIVVMAMVTVIMALSAPRLSRFFSGQSFDEEVRRFSAMIEYARNEAISTSVPIDLYINTETGQYGIMAAAGYHLDEKKMIEFQLNSALAFSLFQQEQIKYKDGIAHIVFLPDGYLDDISVKALKITHQSEQEEDRVIAQTNVGLGYTLLPDGEQGAHDFYNTLSHQGLN